MTFIAVKDWYEANLLTKTIEKRITCKNKSDNFNSYKMMSKYFQVLDWGVFLVKKTNELNKFTKMCRCSLKIALDSIQVENQQVQRTLLYDGFSSVLC